MAPKAAKEPKLSAFEQARLDNIRANEELMRSLGIMGGSSNISMPGDEPTKEQKARIAAERAAASRLASKERRKAMKNQPYIPPDPDAPRRMSSRLSGIDPDPEATKRKREEMDLIENEQSEDYKRARHGVRQLEQLMGSGYKPSEADELKKILSLPFTPSSAAAAQPETQSNVEVKPEIKPEAPSASSDIKPPVPTTEAAGVAPTTEGASRPLNESTNEEKEVPSCTYDLTTLAEHEPRSFPAVSTSRQELEEAISQMTLKSSTKISSKRVYSLAMHPSKDKDLIFLGDKEGGVGIWDPNATAREDESAFIPPTAGYGEPPLEPKTQTFVGASSQQEGEKSSQGEAGEDNAESAPVEDHSNWNANVGKGRSFHLQLHEKKPVTCMRFDPLNPERMYTASYDATIRSLDFNSTTTTSSNGSSTSEGGSKYGIQSREIWAGYDTVLLSIFEILAPQLNSDVFTETPSYGLDERSIWLADHRGGLIHLDLRMPQYTQGQYKRWNVSDKKIGGLTVNPAAPHCVAVGGIDQHVRLFDVRALKNVPEYQEPPFNAATIDKDAVFYAQSQAEIANFDTGNAATSVDWSPRGEHLAAVSYDNTVKIWNVHPSWLHKSSTGTSSSASVSSHPVTVVDPEATSSEARATDKVMNGNGEATAAAATNGEPNPSTSNPETSTSTSAVPVDETSRLDATETSNGEKLGIGIGMKATSPKDALLTPSVWYHNNKTGKWLTAFRVRWHRDPLVEPHFTLGNMDRAAEIFAHDGTLLRSFKHPVFTAVPASTILHPSRIGRMATGNASGYATFWA